jgi:integrase
VAHPGRTGFLTGGGSPRVVAGQPVSPEAAAALAEFLRAFGVDPFGASSRVTVQEWAATWLPIQERERRPKTFVGYQSAVTRWIVPTIGERPLAALGPADMRAVADALRSAGRAATTARYIQTVLIKMLRDAIVEGHAVPTRALAAKRSASAMSDRTSIPLEQATALLEVAAGDPDGSQWAAAFLQGLRQGERLGLTWECVDLVAETMEISWQLQALPYVSGRGGPLRVPDDYTHRRLHGALSLVRPKTGTGRRVIPLVPWMTQQLRAWREIAPQSPHGLVWPRSDGQPMNTKADRAQWHLLQDRAGVRHPSGRYWVGHEIRHTTATLLMNLGVDETVRMAILGHASIEITRRYQHTDLAHSRAALAEAAAALGLG